MLPSLPQPWHLKLPSLRGFWVSNWPQVCYSLCQNCPISAHGGFCPQTSQSHQKNVLQNVNYILAILFTEELNLKVVHNMSSNYISVLNK